MELSIICPTLNEREYIDQVVEDLCISDGIKKEVLIVDGGSTDGTRERVGELMKSYLMLRLIDNPRRTSTAAFNIGVAASNADHVAFVGAHARYSSNYFSYGISRLKSGECDVVGGILRQEGKNQTGRAIAAVMSSSAGVGNTAFRTSRQEQFVDSVAFAIYSRQVLNSVGPMDETLPVNQDDEFHYRIHARGFRLLMTDKTFAVYYVRSSYRSLFKQYFRYGKYKPAVIRKVKGSIKPRHLAPAFFVMYLFTLPLSFIFTLWLIPLLAYLCLIVLYAIRLSRGKFSMACRCVPVFPTLHLAYGSGFILGLFRPC